MQMKRAQCPLEGQAAGQPTPVPQASSPSRESEVYVAQENYSSRDPLIMTDLNMASSPSVPTTLEPKQNEFASNCDVPDLLWTPTNVGIVSLADSSRTDVPNIIDITALESSSINGGDSSDPLWIDGPKIVEICSLNNKTETSSTVEEDDRSPSPMEMPTIVDVWSLSTDDGISSVVEEFQECHPSIEYPRTIPISSNSSNSEGSLSPSLTVVEDNFLQCTSILGISTLEHNPSESITGMEIPKNITDLVSPNAEECPSEFRTLTDGLRDQGSVMGRESHRSLIGYSENSSSVSLACVEYHDGECISNCPESSITDFSKAQELKSLEHSLTSSSSQIVLIDTKLPLLVSDVVGIDTQQVVEVFKVNPQEYSPETSEYLLEWTSTSLEASELSINSLTNSRTAKTQYHTCDDTCDIVKNVPQNNCLAANPIDSNLSGILGVELQKYLVSELQNFSSQSVTITALDNITSGISTDTSQPATQLCDSTVKKKEVFQASNLLQQHPTEFILSGSCLQIPITVSEYENADTSSMPIETSIDVEQFAFNHQHQISKYNHSDLFWSQSSLTSNAHNYVGAINSTPEMSDCKPQFSYLPKKGHQRSSTTLKTLAAASGAVANNESYLLTKKQKRSSPKYSPELDATSDSIAHTSSSLSEQATSFTLPSSCGSATISSSSFISVAARVSSTSSAFVPDVSKPFRDAPVFHSPSLPLESSLQDENLNGNRSGEEQSWNNSHSIVKLTDEEKLKSIEQETE